MYIQNTHVLSFHWLISIMCSYCFPFWTLPTLVAQCCFLTFPSHARYLPLSTVSLSVLKSIFMQHVDKFFASSCSFHFKFMTWLWKGYSRCYRTIIFGSQVWRKEQLRCGILFPGKNCQLELSGVEIAFPQRSTGWGSERELRKMFGVWDFQHYCQSVATLIYTGMLLLKATLIH